MAHLRSIVFSFTVLLTGPGVARAIPPPLGPQKLEEIAQLVVEGVVQSTTFERAVQEGHYTRKHYTSELRVTRTIKGGVRPGATIRIPWRSESWTGEGRHPVGRPPQPIFSTCERVRVYLRGSPEKGYSVVYYSGKQTLQPAPSHARPDDERLQLRCVDGKIH